MAVDEELISMIANGNISAFEQFYKDTYKQVYVFILSMTKCRHTAEDLMHDTYMRIFEKAKNYQCGTSVKTWIMTIARNLTYDYFRKTKRLISFEESGTEDDSSYGYVDSSGVDEHIELENELKKLSCINAQIVVLYDICGYKHREIAEILSVPEGTVRRRYKEAIRQLAREMEGELNE